MPAVQLARVKLQVGEIMTAFNQPAAFVRRLHALLDFYADRTYRPGESGAQPPMLPHYLTPAPVLRQIEADLSLRARDDPPAALALADTLWAEGYFETRLLAIHLLSVLSPQPPHPLLARFASWARATTEPELLNRLLSSGRSRLQGERQDLWLALIHDWLSSDALYDQAVGLRALLSIVNDDRFENIPLIYDLLGPLLSSIPSSLHVEAARVIEGLARRSPAETVFFLRQVLASVQKDESRLVSRLVRRCLPFFDPQTQAKLRSALTDRSKRQEKQAGV